MGVGGLALRGHTSLTTLAHEPERPWALICGARLESAPPALSVGYAPQMGDVPSWSPVLHQPGRTGHRCMPGPAGLAIPAFRVVGAQGGGAGRSVEDW